jgi:hypothetical protein
MVPSNALKIKEIVNGFPNNVLPKIDHEPKFEDIQVTTLLLNANAIAVPSMAGGGAPGHLRIIMIQVEYNMLSSQQRPGWNLSILAPFPSSQQAPTQWVQLR